jgi:rubrerythrin
MNNSESITIKNLEAAFAGESMAYIKYMYFAKVCRTRGDITTAQAFERTANQEVQHAFGHLDLLLPGERLTPQKCLELAIEGETYEYTEMYPGFKHMAVKEGQSNAIKEFDHQIEESKEHADYFKTVLEKAAKRFAALEKVEKRHAEHYQSILDTAVDRG